MDLQRLQHSLFFCFYLKLYGWRKILQILQEILTKFNHGTHCADILKTVPKINIVLTIGDDAMSGFYPFLI